MTSSLSPTRAPVPRTLLGRLWIALAVGTTSLALTTAQGFVRDGYDSWHQAVSALSLGPGGWVQMANLVAFGLTILWTTPTWRRLLSGGTGATAYPLLTALIGMSFVAVGLIPQDPAPGYDPAGLNLTAPTPGGLTHLAFAGIAALSSVISLCVMAARLSGDSEWRGWPLYSSLAAAAMVVCIAVYGVWSIQSTGYAGTFERAAMVIPMLWNFVFLLRLHGGRPFMVARA